MKKASLFFILAAAVVLSLFAACSKDEEDFGKTSNKEKLVTIENHTNRDIAVIVMDGAVYDFPAKNEFQIGNAALTVVVNANQRNDAYYTRGTRAMLQKGWPTTIFVTDYNSFLSAADYSRLPHAGLVLKTPPDNWTLTYPDDFQ